MVPLWGLPCFQGTPIDEAQRFHGKFQEEDFHGNNVVLPWKRCTSMRTSMGMFMVFQFHEIAMGTSMVLR